MKLVFGLGNPGKKYGNTRHNVGFLVVDRITAQNRVTVKKKICNSLVGEWHVDGERVLLVKPQTFMNCSGEALRDLSRRYPASTEDIVVVHDDLDLPFGRIRIRARGGPGGHRGVLSILESLGEEEFHRVRIGIGRPPAGVDPTDFVLESFNEQEAGQLDAIVSRGADAVVCLLQEGSRRAMELFNRAD